MLLLRKNHATFRTTIIIFLKNCIWKHRKFLVEKIKISSSIIHIVGMWFLKYRRTNSFVNGDSTRNEYWVPSCRDKRIYIRWVAVHNLLPLPKSQTLNSTILAASEVSSQSVSLSGGHCELQYAIQWKLWRRWPRRCQRVYLFCRVKN